jgi:hypothetical protein
MARPKYVYSTATSSRTEEPQPRSPSRGTISKHQLNHSRRTAKKGLRPKYHSSNNEPVIESDALRYSKTRVYANEEDEQRQWEEHGVDDDHGIAVSFWIDIVWRGPRSDHFWRWESHYLLYCIRPHSQRPRLHSFCICNRQDTGRERRGVAESIKL